MAGASVSEIARVFGTELAEQMADLSPGPWTGPLRSTYGLHLVRIGAREPGRMPSLEEVRTEVVRDWEHQRRGEASEAFYESLRGRYEILVQAGPEANAESAGGGGRE